MALGRVLQHAHNPVQWRPWGPEALALAKEGQKPIFLSVGYSTCHWCHVMEEESFEDEEIASTLNTHFICIKVDREERPDVDGIYMTAVQALTGHGGWPMSVFMTPDLLPFFAGTYFPARDGDRGSSMGFLTIIERLALAWERDRQRIVASAEEITAELQTLLRAPRPTDLPDLRAVDDAIAFFASRYDPEWGGLHPAPKFPSSLPLRVLLRQWRRTGDKKSLEMATHTFKRMANGGLYDQVGGGFHRYSTDEKWLIPHFEKMLYDNALLVMAGVELFQATGDRTFRDVSCDVLEYVLREMTASDGTFFSATDADSEAPDGRREEGWFFTWTPAELAAELGEERARLCALVWGVTERGNFEGRNQLWLPRSLAEVAEREQILEDTLARTIAECRPILYRARQERPAPARDDKVLVAWNGLMISAFARASFAFSMPQFLEVAERAAQVILAQGRAEDGRVLRVVRKEGTRPQGTLQDHAYFIQALVDLFEVTGGVSYLEHATALESLISQHFEDEQAGGFFLTANDAENLLAREKPNHDGAEPSGNSVHALNLVRLGRLLDDPILFARAEKTLRAFGQVLRRHPAAMAELLIALEMLHAPSQETVIVRANHAAQDADARALEDAVRTAFCPNRVLITLTTDNREALTKRIPAARHREAAQGKTTVFVCRRGSCQLPATTSAQFLEALSA